MNSNNSESSLSKGMVAKSLRKVLHSDLNDHDVESISIILICHLMMENRINSLLYKWMTDSITYMGSEEDEEAVLLNKNVREQVDDSD